MPIKLDTYRDDTLLLAHEQNSSSIKFFKWSGTLGGFIPLSDYPCSFYDDQSNITEGKHYIILKFILNCIRTH